jgi:predicted lactoylglutathione lyase
MIKSLTVNIAVREIAQSAWFLEQLGFQIDPMFAEDPGMELIKLSDSVYVMLNSESRFVDISLKQLVDTSKQAEAILQLRVDSREQVDQIVDAALSQGGLRIHEPNDQGGVYGRSFQDLDGHNWDVFCVGG